MKYFVIILFLFVVCLNTFEGFVTMNKKLHCVENNGVQFCVIDKESKDEAMTLLQDTYLHMKNFLNYLETNYPERVETKHFHNYDFKYITESIIKEKPAYFMRMINEIGLCLYEPDGKLVKRNVLFYILLHEITHTLYKGHSQTFWDSFNFLTNTAIQGKFLSKGVDLNYCSRKIDIISRQ